LEKEGLKRILVANTQPKLVKTGNLVMLEEHMSSGGVGYDTKY